jgi:hypothetical protein
VPAWASSTQYPHLDSPGSIPNTNTCARIATGCVGAGDPRQRWTARRSSDRLVRTEDL